MSINPICGMGYVPGFYDCVQISNDSAAWMNGHSPGGTIAWPIYIRPWPYPTPNPPGVQTVAADRNCTPHQMVVLATRSGFCVVEPNGQWDPSQLTGPYCWDQTSTPPVVPANVLSALMGYYPEWLTCMRTYGFTQGFYSLDSMFTGEGSF
jgi:hypothetical protein